MEFKRAMVLAIFIYVSIIQEPAYELIVDKTEIRISIKNKSGQLLHEYSSENSLTVDDACEQAARKAVEDLAHHCFIYIEDMTSMKQQEVDRCTELYKMKCMELERLEKGWGRMLLPENLLTELCGYDEIVSVDFIAILRSVLKRFIIPSTPLEAIEHTPNTFTAWLSMAPLESNLVPHTIFSDYRQTLELAKQNLARKVLAYLTPLYNFDVIDANYNPRKLEQLATLCNLERQRYLTLKDRVLGLKENFEPTFMLMEPDCITPKATAYKIPVALNPPLPPKKRKSFSKHASASSAMKPKTEGEWIWPSPPHVKVKHSTST